MEEYLTPSGKKMTEYELSDLSMEQVFNMLIKLDVADKALYRDYLRVNDLDAQRSRSRVRSRVAYQQPRIVYYRTPITVTRKLLSPQKYYVAPPLPGVRPNSLIRLRKVRGPVSPPKKIFTAPTVQPGKVSCGVWGGKNMCLQSGCQWIDGVCYDL